MSQHDTPKITDDRDAAERKSRSVDERIPERESTDLVPGIELPGAFGAQLPQAGLGASGPIDGGELGPGEAALAKEAQAQRAPIQRG